jgi:hypothetical protein
MDQSHREQAYEDNSQNQDKVVDVLVEIWESQERGRLVDPPRWVQ